MRFSGVLQTMDLAPVVDIDRVSGQPNQLGWVRRRTARPDVALDNDGRTIRFAPPQARALER